MVQLNTSRHIQPTPAAPETVRSEINQAWLLGRGLKSLLRCDEAEVVHEIARYVVAQHRSLRLLSRLIERTRRTPVPGVVALIGFLKAFLGIRPGRRGDGVAWIARLSNERAAIESLKRFAPDLFWNELKFGSVANRAALVALWRRGDLRRIFRIVRRLHARHEFFKVLRVIELIGYYSRYVEVFGKGTFSLAVSSNHSNPHGIAFNLAARKFGVPTVLITHGMPVQPVARLDHDLAVVHCEAARRIYLQQGCQLDSVLIHGRRQNYAPMPAVLTKQLSVGLFLCKDVNEEKLRHVVEHLLGHPQVSRIMVRPHPKNLWRGFDKWIASQNNSRLCPASGESVFSDVKNVDIVLAGNSSVLIDGVTAGRLSGYVPGLDHGSADLHAFVQRGVVYGAGNKSGEFNFEPEAMLHFYQRRDWPGVLRLFANVDEDEASVASRAVEIMRDLARGKSGRTGCVLSLSGRDITGATMRGRKL